MARESGQSPPEGIPLSDVSRKSSDLISPAAIESAHRVQSPETLSDGKLTAERDKDSTNDPPYPLPNDLFAKRSDLPEHERIDNPFAAWDEDEAIEVAQRLAYEYDLQKSEAVFVRAARVLWAQRDADGPRLPNDDDPDAPIEEVHKLSAEEQEAVRNEGELSFWEQPWPLKTTYLMLFVAAATQGWTQTATNGANLSWPAGLGLGGGLLGNGTETGKTYGTTSCGSTPHRIWVFAAVNAAPYLAAGVFCLFSDLFINELRFGRRGAIIVSSVFVLVAAILGSATRKAWQFALTRVLLGFGMGCKASVVPVFAAEIAPPHLRGTLVMNWQVFDAMGIFLGFTANLIASVAGNAAWRWQVGSSALPAFALFWGTMFVCWDSPRFLMKHEKRYQRQYKKRNSRTSSNIGCLAGRKRTAYRSDAYNTLLLLRGEPILAAKELIYAHCQLLVEKGSRKGTTFADYMSSKDMALEYGSGVGAWASRFKRLLTEGFIRRELLAAAAAMISQQLCGINVLIFYSSTVFCQTSSASKASDSSLPPSALKPLLLSWGLGLCNFLFTFPAYKWIETRGRRDLILWTLPWLAIIMAAVAAALSRQIPQVAGQPPSPTPIYSAGRRDATIVLAYLFTAIYAFGLGPVPFTLSAEMFPLEERMVGMSVAVALNLLGAGFLTLLVPPLTNNPAILLGPFAVLNFAAYIFVWIFVREVAKERVEVRKGTSPKDSKRMEPLTLEELYRIFEPSIPQYVKYQWQRMTGWRVGNSVTDSFLEWTRDPEKRQRGGNVRRRNHHQSTGDA